MNDENEEVEEESPLVGNFNTRLAQIGEFYRISPTDILFLLEGHMDECHTEYLKGYDKGQADLCIKYETKPIKREE